MLRQKGVNFLVGAISPDRRDARKLCVGKNISAVMQLKHRCICESFQHHPRIQDYEADLP